MLHRHSVHLRAEANPTDIGLDSTFVVIIDQHAGTTTQIRTADASDVIVGAIDWIKVVDTHHAY